MQSSTTAFDGCVGSKLGAVEMINARDWLNPEYQ